MEQSINFDAIPDDLKKLNQWIGWKPVKKPNGKVTKQPLNVHTGGKASSTKKSTWSDFDTVTEAFMFGDTYGLGITFSKEHPLMGIDLDDCFRPNGELKTWARKVVDHVASYTEVSPSKNGLHILCYSDDLEGMSFCKDGREIYTDGRYFTVTGDVFEGRDQINHRTSEARSIHDGWRKHSETEHVEKFGRFQFDKGAVVTPIDEIGLTDGEVAMFVTGEGVRQDKRSEDLYYLVQQMIACGANNETILTHCTNDQYFLGQVALSPSRANGNVRKGMWWIWNQMLPKARHVITKHINEAVDELFDDDDDVSDIVGDEDDEVIEKPEKKRVKYSKSYHHNVSTYLDNNGLVRHKSQYYHYNGKSWELYHDELVERDIYNVLEPYGLSYSVLNQTISGVKRKSTINHFNVSKNMLAFNNGVINLSNWDCDQIDTDLQQHDPDLHILSLLEYDYDPGAECPQWLRFLNEVFENDQQRVRLLQQWFGYSLIYDYRFQKLLVMLGKSRSGKGVITKILQKLIGQDAFAGSTMSNLAGDFGLDAVKSAKVISIADAHRAPKQKIERMKEILLNITGGDMVAINRKGKDELITTIPGRIMMAANVLPSFIDVEDALLNRYLILPFTVTFAGREDVELYDKLEKELSGIFNWAMQGLIDLGMSGRFIEPDISQERKNEIRERQNPIGAFITECIVLDEEEMILVDDAYRAYEVFCDQRGIHIDDRRLFGKRILDLPDVEKTRPRSRGGAERLYYYRGVRFKDLDHQYSDFLGDD